MQIKRFIHYLVLSVALFSMSAVAYAEKRCPASDTSCTIDDGVDRIKARADDGLEDVSKAKGPVKKAKEAGKTVKDCIKCGLEAVEDGFKKATGQNAVKNYKMDD